MDLERGRISSSQLIILITGSLIGSSVILSPGSEAGRDAWLAIIAGLLVSLVFVWIFTSLSNRYPGKTLVEINEIVYGSYLGKIISLFYLWYFFHLGAFVLRDFGDFFNTFMPSTPLPIFIIFTLLICASVVRNGVESIVHTSIILVPFIIFLFISDLFLILPKIDLSNLLPILDISAEKFIKASHSAAIFPFGETIASLMLVAFLNKHREGRSSIIKGLLFAGLFLIISTIRNTAVLGATASITTYPSFTVVHLIDLEIISRVEILISVSLLCMGFLKISVMYYGTVLGMAQVLKINSYRPLVLPIGILMFIMSIIQFDSSVENFFFSITFYPYSTLLFQFFLPLITLITAATRKK